MTDYPLTLTHAFERAERLFAEKTVVTASPKGRERVAYGEWAERTRRLGGALGALGLSEDARVGTFAWNTSRHLELYFAAPCTGRVLHTLNIRLFPEQLVYIANHAADEAIFVDRSLIPLLWPNVAKLETVKHFVVMDDGADAEIPDDDRILDYEELIADAEPADMRVDDEGRAAAMCYTSGTTGNPKGVLYSHRSALLHCIGTMFADSLGVSERDVILPVVPMFHANAWGLAYSAVLAGASLVMPGPDLSPGAIADLMESERVTLAAGVPTIWNGVLGELDGRDLTSLDRIVCGGSAVPRALSEAYREKIGMPILQAWGMTETSPLGSVCRVKSTLADGTEDELADLRSSIGIPVALVDARIVEPGGDSELPRDGEAAASCRSQAVDRRRLLRGRALVRILHRRRLAANRRRRHHRRARLHAPRRPHQGPRQVGGRVDQLGRARERDHGPPEGPRGMRRSASPTRSGASGHWPASSARTGATSSPPTTSRSTSTAASPSGGSRRTSSSSTRSRRPPWASSRRRTSASASRRPRSG